MPSKLDFYHNALLRSLSVTRVYFAFMLEAAIREIVGKDVPAAEIEKMFKP